MKMMKWKEAGSPKGEGPFKEIEEEFGVNRRHVNRLYEHWKKVGNVARTKPPGRPPDFENEVWANMVTIIREARLRHARASAPYIRTKMKEMGWDNPPCLTTIVKKKKEMGYELINVKVKPKLNSRLRTQRLAFAKKYHKRTLKDVVKSGSPKRRRLPAKLRPGHPHP